MTTNNWIPSIEIETASGTREVSLKTHMLSQRTIYIDEEITADSAQNFAMQLAYLEEDPGKEINIIINSPGGSVDAGLMIYDLIQGSPLKINMYCTNMAASMGAFILAGGQPGRRYILPHSRTMIHEPLISGSLQGSTTSICNLSENMLKTKRMINSLLAKHTGRSLKEIDRATGFDNYMDANESVKFGICDQIVPSIRRVGR